MMQWGDVEGKTRQKDFEAMFDHTRLMEAISKMSDIITPASAAVQPGCPGNMRLAGCMQ
jgi:hypothetical protein